MLDGVSLDQLRTFIAAADEGSFSAAGRRLGRAQSVVSQTLANLEGQLGLPLFERVARYPVLTEAGHALLAEARMVISDMDTFKARAKLLAGGLEPELSVAVDVMFPTDVLTEAVAGFHAHFPAVPLRLYVEALGAVIAPVLDGRCAFGIIGSLPTAPEGFRSERLLAVPLRIVVSPRHPLAAYGAAPVPLAAVSEHVQLVLTDRSQLSSGREFGVMSQKTWRLADLGAKHAFLRAGLGWGTMANWLIAGDLASGTLVPIHIQDSYPLGYMMTMSATYPADRPPGPAGRWLIHRLTEAVSEDPRDSDEASDRRRSFVPASVDRAISDFGDVDRIE